MVQASRYRDPQGIPHGLGPLEHYCLLQCKSFIDIELTVIVDGRQQLLSVVSILYSFVVTHELTRTVFSGMFQGHQDGVQRADILVAACGV